MKKSWIIVAAIMAALIIAMVVMSFVFKPDQEPSGDEDSLYPYTYSEGKNGITVTFTGKFPDNHKWSGETKNSAVFNVTEKSQNIKKASFLVSPESAGYSNGVFTLRDGSGTPVYEITVEFYVSPALEISVVESSHDEPAAPEIGKGTGYEYTVLLYDDELTVNINGDDEDTWMLESDGYGVSAELESETNTDRVYKITCYDVYNGTVKMADTEKGEAIEITICADWQGIITGFTHAVKPWEEAQNDMPGLESYEKQFGALTLPHKAELTDVGTRMFVSDADGKAYVIGWSEFKMDGADWTLWMGENMPVSAFKAEAADKVLAISAPTGESVSASVYYVDSGCTCCWQENDGRGYMLTGNGISEDTLIPTVRSIMQVMING